MSGAPSRSRKRSGRSTVRRCRACARAMYRGSNHGPWAFSCVPPARSLGEILARFCGFSRCYGQENFPSVFLALTSPVAHAEGSGAMMRSCSSRPRHRASAIVECIRGVQTAEGGRRFQFCIERFQSVGRLFLQLGNLVTFNFGILAALGRSARSAARLVPDVVASRLLRPYHFPALIQSFQSVAAPFPGDSDFDRGCGLGRAVGSAAGAPKPPRWRADTTPLGGAEDTDGTNAGLFRYTEGTVPGIPFDRKIYRKNLLYICFSFEISDPTPRRTRSAGPA
jgi:hypothetical protein